MKNVGNTCYLNSSFQALFRVKPFAEYFGTDAWMRHRHEDRRGYELAAHTANLVQLLQSPGTDAVAPLAFANSFIELAGDFNPTISRGAQADAAEAIQILLDGLHMQLAREVAMNIRGDALTTDQGELIKSLESWATFYRKEYTLIVDTFFGQTQKKIVCDTCRTCSSSYEPWSVFKVPIPGGTTVGSPAPTLDECIAKALESEKLDDYDCETCAKKGPATIHLAISKFPKHMILSFKRFVGSGAKIRCRIPYDENNVKFDAYRAWPTIQAAPSYRVTSTVEHLGSSRGGHYVMRAKSPEDGTWQLYDDERVSPCTIGGTATRDTYMLFLEMA